MRLPKWTQNAIRERRGLFANTAESLIEELQEIPPHAYIEIEDDFGYCGESSPHLMARWSRSMTEAEYVREKKRRKEHDKIAKERDRLDLERLAKKLGVEL